MEFIKSLLAGIYVRLLAYWMVAQCRVWSAYRAALVKLAGAVRARSSATDAASRFLASRLPLIEGELAKVDASMAENGCSGSSGGGGSR